MLHNVCPDAAAFVRTGLAFLKSSFSAAGYSQAISHRQAF
jgi:hypothetical protein